MTYEEALAYIHGINWVFSKPGLERTRKLCEGLGNPEDSLSFIHVAGTNGKGSFCSMLSSVLTAAGYRVGLYTSPFIYRFNERMRINGEDIPDDTLAKITERVRPIADSMEDKPTEFELITAIAFEYFKKEGCDIVILEAGMGGRLDSTNVIKKSLLSVITGIALDHTAFLGDTVEKIAREKAGIIKSGCPILFGGEDIGAKKVVRERALSLGADFFGIDYGGLNVRSATLSGSLFDFEDRRILELPLLGLYQPKNAALVLKAVDILRSRGLAIGENAIKSGLKSAKWRARFEIISSKPTVIFDGAHNSQGIDSAVESIKHYFKGRRIVVLCGVLKDKDYIAIARRISKVASYAFTITPDNSRALKGEELAKILSDMGVASTASPDIKTAITEGRKRAKEENTALCCLGSLYTYVDVINNL